MKKFDIDIVQPGDILLTARKAATSKGIRLASWGKVSHAMICVQHSSVIDSTSNGVQSHNLQRIFLGDWDGAFVFRMRQGLSSTQLDAVITYARAEVGTRYSLAEATRSVAGVLKPRSARQFCSRLVARSYAYAGIGLVDDEDYCTPDALLQSPLLKKVPDAVVPALKGEVAAWRARPDPTSAMSKAHNAILAVARAFDPAIENLEQVDQLVAERAECDLRLSAILKKSGYLDLWEHDVATNPWHYDLAEMNRITDDTRLADLRAYCILRIREEQSEGKRFVINLAGYETRHRLTPRQYFALLIDLYKMLVASHHQRCAVALAWLEEHFPEDAVHLIDCSRGTGAGAVPVGTV